MFHEVENYFLFMELMMTGKPWKHRHKYRTLVIIFLLDDTQHILTQVNNYPLFEVLFYGWVILQLFGSDSVAVVKIK